MFNYRSDRMREITAVLGMPDKPMEVNIPEDLVRYSNMRYWGELMAYHQSITTMSKYNPAWTFPVAFPPSSMENTLAEWLGKQGVKQAHIAGKLVWARWIVLFPLITSNIETEKYAHVTFFFNGGVEKQFPGEERMMIPSPKVATYDKQPEMSVQDVADKVAEVVKSSEFDFVMCNFAPPDMVSLIVVRW
jgi:2,3-bisphosphoglycerate-independent phosphoglycerate mutase